MPGAAARQPVASHQESAAPATRPRLALVPPDPHPARAPGRDSTWPGLWSARDAVLTLAVLGEFLVIQALVVALARSGPRLPFAASLAIALFPTFATAGTVLLSARARGLTWRELGFVRPRNWHPIVIAWLVAIFAGPLTHWSGTAFSAVGTPTSAGGALDVAAGNLNLGVAALLALVLGMLVPLVEEVIFRGVIHRTFRTRWTWFPAAVLSGLIFAAVHLDAPHIAPLFIVGFILAWSYERSGSLWGAILPHGGLNAMTVLVLTTRA